MRHDADVPGDVSQEVLGAEFQLDEILRGDALRRRLFQIAIAANGFEARDLARVLSVAAPAINPGLLHAWVETNLEHIKNMAVQQIDEIRTVIKQGFVSGVRHEELADKLVKQGSILENRARLIARNEIGNLNSQLTTSRHQALGISRFVWSTAGDERVRDEHALLDGQEFSYNNPPDEGLPGEPIGCRCNSYPILPNEE